MLHVVVAEPIACCKLAEFLIATVTGARAHLYKLRRSARSFFSRTLGQAQGQPEPLQTAKPSCKLIYRDKKFKAKTSKQEEAHKKSKEM
jgi:hypothetical protein